VLNLFQRKPIIDAGSSQWILDQYHRLFDTLGKQVFIDQTQLILPTDEFFPASATNTNELALLSFKQIKAHATLSNWPIDLQFNAPATTQKLPQLNFERALYGQECQVTSDFSPNNRIQLSSSSNQFANPQTAISHLIMQLSSVLLRYSENDIDKDYELPRIEVLASFLGFGVMLSNTTYQFRGGCGSCYQASANRQHSLTEEEMIYALAVFCRLKKIDTAQVTPHLKGYLRGVFKRCNKALACDAKFAQLQARC